MLKKRQSNHNFYYTSLISGIKNCIFVFDDLPRGETVVLGEWHLGMVGLVCTIIDFRWLRLAARLETESSFYNIYIHVYTSLCFVVLLYRMHAHRAINKRDQTDAKAGCIANQGSNSKHDSARRALEKSERNM